MFFIVSVNIRMLQCNILYLNDFFILNLSLNNIYLQ